MAIEDLKGIAGRLVIAVRPDQGAAIQGDNARENPGSTRPQSQAAFKHVVGRGSPGGEIQAGQAGKVGAKLVAEIGRQRFLAVAMPGEGSHEYPRLVLGA